MEDGEILLVSLGRRTWSHQEFLFVISICQTPDTRAAMTGNQCPSSLSKSFFTLAVIYYNCAKLYSYLFPLRNI